MPEAARAWIRWLAPSRDWRAIRRRARRTAGQVLHFVAAPWRYRAEVLHVSCILGGWGLTTWGVSDLVGVWQVWPISAGLFLLSVAGWGHLSVLFLDGLYEHLKPPRPPGES